MNDLEESAGHHHHRTQHSQPSAYNENDSYYSRTVSTRPPQCNISSKPWRSVSHPRAYG